MKFTFTRGGGRADRAASAKGLFRGSVAAVCLLAMLGLASCGGSDGGSTQAQAQTQMPMTNMMNGYFLTQGSDGVVTCQSEDLTMTENADGTVNSTSDFDPVKIGHRGYKAENEGSNTEIIGLGYAAFDSDGTSNIRNPGIYYFQKISAAGEPNMFGGLWIGKPNRPEDGREGMICPYIMVADPDDMDAGECPSDIDEMLGDTCYRTNDMGFVNPMAPVERGDSDDQ